MKMKKLISFLCAAALTVSSFAGLAVTASAAADTVAITPTVGSKTVTVKKEGTTVTQGVLLHAVYANGALTSVESQNIPATASADAEVTYTKADYAAYVDSTKTGSKFLAWNSLAGMEPITVNIVEPPAPKTAVNTVAELAVTATNNSKAPATLTAAVTAKSGQTFTDTTAFTYAWTKDGETVADATTATLADAVAGTYTVTATYNGTGDYEGSLGPATITIAAADDTRTNLSGATVTVTPAGTVYTNTELTAAVAIPGAEEGDVATTVPAADLDYAWSKKGDSDAWTPVADATAATFTPTEAGTYKVTVTAKEASENYVGTRDSAEITVIVPADYVTAANGKIKAISVAAGANADKTYKQLKLDGVYAENDLKFAKLDTEVTVLAVDVTDYKTVAATNKVTLKFTTKAGGDYNDKIGSVKLSAPTDFAGLTYTGFAALTQSGAVTPTDWSSKTEEVEFKREIQDDIVALEEGDNILYYAINVGNGRQQSLKADGFAITSETFHTATVATGITGGTVTLNKTEKLVAGDKVIVTVAATNGYDYTANSLSVKDASNADVTVTAVEGQDGKYEFTMPDSNVTVTAAFTEIQLDPSVVTINYKNGEDTVKTDTVNGYIGRAIDLTSKLEEFNIDNQGGATFKHYTINSGAQTSITPSAATATVDIAVSTNGRDYYYYEDFDSSSTDGYEGGTANSSLAATNKTGNNTYFALANNGQSGGRNAYLTLKGAKAISDDYVIEMDLALQAPDNGASSTVYLAGSGTAASSSLLTLTGEKGATVWTLANATGTPTYAFKGITMKTYGRFTDSPANFAVSNFTHVKITVDFDNTTATVELDNDATKTYTLTVPAGTVLSQVFGNFARYSSGAAIDNIEMYKYVAPAKTPLTSVAISGTAKVGETLTATVAPNGATATYQWKKADTADGTYTDITDATSSTYVLTADEAGKFIKVEATGSGDYYTTVLSSATEAVAAADTPATQATTATITAVDANTDLYGKKLADLTDNFAITGTDKAYKATGTLKYVTGYTGFSSNAAEQSGNYLPFVVNVDGYNENSTIKIKGNAQGSTETTYTYADYNDDKFFVFILGGQSTSLSIKVDRDGSGTDYEETEYTLSWTKAETAGEADKLYFTPAPTPVTAVAITGTPKLGETLTATTTPANATVTYQWQRADAADGTYTNIDGATAATYKLTTDDVDKFVKVVATAGTGYSGEVSAVTATAVAPTLLPLEAKTYNFNNETTATYASGDGYMLGYHTAYYVDETSEAEAAHSVQIQESEHTIHGIKTTKRFVFGGASKLDGNYDMTKSYRILEVLPETAGIIEVGFVNNKGTGQAETRTIAISQNNVDIATSSIDIGGNTDYVVANVAAGKKVYIYAKVGSVSATYIKYTPDAAVYSVTSTPSDDATIAVSGIAGNAVALPGDTVTVTVTPTSGKTVTGLTVTKTDTTTVNAVKGATNAETGAVTYTFTMPESAVTLAATAVAATTDKPNAITISAANTVDANNTLTFTHQLLKDTAPSSYANVAIEYAVYTAYTDGTTNTPATVSTITNEGVLSVPLTETAQKLYVVATAKDTADSNAVLATSTPFEVTVNTTYVTQSFSFVRPDGSDTPLESGYVVATEGDANTFSLTALLEIATGARKYESAIVNGAATLNLNPNKKYTLTVKTAEDGAVIDTITDYAPTKDAATTPVKETITAASVPENDALTAAGVTSITPANAIVGDEVTITIPAADTGVTITGVKVNGTIDAEKVTDTTYKVTIPAGGITSVAISKTTKTQATISTFEGEQFGKQQSDLNEGLTFTKVEGENTYKATGTLKYVSGWTEFDGSNEELQSGNYISFQVAVTGGTEASTISVVGNAQGSTPINVTKASEDFVIHLGGQSTALIVKVDKDGSGTDYSEETYTITLEKAANASEAATKLYYAPEVVAPTTKWTERTGSADAATYSITAAKEGDDVVTTITANSGNNVAFKYNLGNELSENWHSSTSGKELVVSYDLYVDGTTFDIDGNDWYLDLLTTDAAIKDWHGADDSCLVRMAGYNKSYLRFVGGKAGNLDSDYIYQTANLADKTWVTITERVDLTGLNLFAVSYSGETDSPLHTKPIKKGVDALTTDNLYLALGLNSKSGTNSIIKIKNVSAEVVDAPTYAITSGTVTGGTLTINPETAKMGDTVTVTPSTGVFESITADGVVNLTNNSDNATFVMPAKAVAVNAAITNDKVVTVVNTKKKGNDAYYEGGIISTASTTYAPNAEVTVTGTPYLGYKLDTVTVNDGETDTPATVNGNTATFNMPDSNVTISATWTDEDENTKVLPFTTSTVTKKTTLGGDNGQKIGFRVDGELYLMNYVWSGTEVTFTGVDYTNLKKVSVVSTRNPASTAVTASFTKGLETTPFAAPVTTNGVAKELGTPNVTVWAASDDVTGTLTGTDTMTVALTSATENDSSHLNNYWYIVLEYGTSTPEPTTYTITLPGTNGTVTGGKVTASATSDLEENTPVTLTVDPDEGYQLKSISAKYNTDTDVTLTGPTAVEGTDNTTYTFTMPAGNVSVSAEFEFVTNVTITADGTYIDSATDTADTDNRPTIKVGAAKVSGGAITSQSAGNSGYSTAGILSVDASEYVGRIHKATLTITAVAEGAKTTLRLGQYANYIDFAENDKINATNIATLGGTAATVGDIGEVQTSSTDLTYDITSILRSSSNGKKTLFLLTSTARMVTATDVKVKLEVTEDTIPAAAITVHKVYKDNTNGTISIDDTEDKYVEFGTNEEIANTAGYYVGDNFTPAATYTTAIDDGETSRYEYVSGAAVVELEDETNDVYIVYNKIDYQTTTFSVTLPAAAGEGGKTVNVKLAGTPTATGASEVDTNVAVTVAAGETTGTATYKLLPGTYTYAFVQTEEYLAKDAASVTVGSTNAMTLEANEKTETTATVNYVTNLSDVENTTVKTATITGIYEGDPLNIEDESYVSTYLSTFTIDNTTPADTFKRYTVNAYEADTYKIASLSATASNNVINVIVSTDNKNYYYYEDFSNYTLGTAWSGVTTASNSKTAAVDDTNIGSATNVGVQNGLTIGANNKAMAWSMHNKATQEITRPLEGSGSVEVSFKMAVNSQSTKGRRIPIEFLDENGNSLISIYGEGSKNGNTQGIAYSIDGGTTFTRVETTGTDASFHTFDITFDMTNHKISLSYDGVAKVTNENMYAGTTEAPLTLGANVASMHSIQSSFGVLAGVVFDDYAVSQYTAE